MGVVTGDGRVVLHDAADDSTPVNLELDKILGSLPQKTFIDASKPVRSHEIDFSQELLRDKRHTAQNIVDETLDRVLRLLQIGSKRFLTTKVDAKKDSGATAVLPTAHTTRGCRNSGTVASPWTKAAKI